ncbi:uncharacterized protein [Nicotiana sylvestris]|uniref:uncharacterized protein n=1 Tax=Nicotiana sylvestris TaxID=4096 RepID=UPI00388C91C9
MVADALSRWAESLKSLAYLPASERPMAIDFQALASQFVRLDLSEPSRILACVVFRSYLFDRIKEWQYDDPHLLVLKDKVQHGDAKDVTIGDDGVLRMQGRICVPNIDELRELILEEAHSSRYSIHSGATKMYQDLRQHYWWKWMKNDIVGFVARCLKCQQGSPEETQDLISSETPEEINEPETQVREELLISSTGDKINLNRSEIVVDKIFAYNIALNIMQYSEDLEPRSVKQFRRRSDWPKWQEEI